MMKSVVAGSTGFVGEELVRALAGDQECRGVLALSRKGDVWDHFQVKAVNADLSDPESLKSVLKGSDALYCCLGTTIRTAGSKEAFEQVDFVYVLNLLKAAEIAGVKQFHVISAMGADIHSMFFYSRVKGKMEAAVAESTVPARYIYRPGLLGGGRKEWRTGERMAEWIMMLFRPLMLGPLRKYRTVHRRRLAACMLHYSKQAEPGVHIIASERILDFPL
jgi:uncharacterized protein YbjT (DUF2867 family)